MIFEDTSENADNFECCIKEVECSSFVYNGAECHLDVSKPQLIEWCYTMLGTWAFHFGK